MANDHARDRYDPPKVGSEFEEDKFSEINPGEIFRLQPLNESTSYRKVNDLVGEEIGTIPRFEVRFDAKTKVYVKS
jgi:hypothetical protein